MPPNILHISTHDSGRHLGCYGIDSVRTPNIDRLAAEGVLLEQAFAVSPICSPSRATALSGLYPQRNGLMGLTHQGFSLHPDTRHAAELLREQGYQSVLFSFQHEHVIEAWERLGFEEYRCRESGESQYPFMFQPAPEVARDFAAFLEEREDSRPFYAQVGFNESHTPFWFGGAVPDREQGVQIPAYLVGDEDAERHIAGLQGALKQADDGVGLLVEALETQGLLEHTLIIFCTDHGIESQRDKWTLYDAGLETALILRGPGLPAGQRLNSLFSQVDLLPSMMGLCGLEFPNDLDGCDRSPELQSESPLPGPEEIYGIYYNGACRCVRSSSHKLIWNLGPEPYVTSPPVPLNGSGAKTARPVWELYDLATDPDEFNNLAGQADLAEVERDLKSKLRDWLQRMDDPCCLL